MQKRAYTVIFAHDPRGQIRKVRLPGYLVHLVLLAALIGVGAVLTGVASYAHLLLTVHDYRQVRAEREELRALTQTLQATNTETRQRLTSLESLAHEVAAPAVTLYASGVPPLPGQDLTQLNYTPSLWPVRGQLAGSFGNRMDPFSGEGAFHAGVDISAESGAAVRAAADGFVVWANRRSGSGRLVVIDHGGGLTTWYAHLSNFQAYRGQAVQRGDIIGYARSSRRPPGPP